MTLGHLECASNASGHMLLRNGPAKSKCTRSHGLSGIGHGDKLAAGDGAVTAQTLHALQQVSMVVSMFGHQTYSRAMVFMRTIPRWDWCSMVITLLWSSCGTITRQSRSRTPFISQIAICALMYGFRASILHSGPEVGQPLRTKFTTCDRTLSFLVHSSTSFDVIGNSFIYTVAICWTSAVIASTSSSRSNATSGPAGSRERASALLCSAEER